MKAHAVSLVFLVVFACVARAEVRKWTDGTGKYSVQAELVDVKDGKVHLRRADGRVVAVPLEKLGAADQEYIKQKSGRPPLGREKTPRPAEAVSKPIWTMDLAKMVIPDLPAAGAISGQDFTVQEAKLEGGILTLREGKEFFPDKSVKLFLFLKEGETLVGKTFRIAPNREFGGPQVHVHVQWKPKGDQGFGQTEIFMDKYAVVLEFGRLKDNAIPGKIYLCLPDKSKSYVAGTFTIGGAGTMKVRARETISWANMGKQGPLRGLAFPLLQPLESCDFPNPY